MTLPVIPLPFAVPEVIPVLLHPVVVHFAVVLPLLILTLELINLVTKRKSLTITIYVLFVLLVAVFVGALATGVIDGKNGGLLMSDEGLEHLKSHKLIGIYLLYLSALPILLKLFTLVVKKPWAKVIYLLSFVAIITLTLYQAKEGGELVYEYGLNVEAKTNLDDTVEELQDEMDELKESYEEKIATLKAQLGENNETVVQSTTTLAPSKPIVVESNATKAMDVNASATKIDANITNSSDINSTK